MDRKKKRTKGRLQQYLAWPAYFAAAVAAVNGIVVFVDRTAGLVMLPLTVACVIGAGLLWWYQRTRLYQDAFNLTKDNERIQHSILTGLPVPYGLMDEDG